VHREPSEMAWDIVVRDMFGTGTTRVCVVTEEVVVLHVRMLSAPPPPVA
jgi:hypothetical protein